MDTLKISVEELSKALTSLEESIKITNPNSLERDGSIKRFEYCFEMSWKLAKKYMESEGVTNISSPKAVIREMAAQGLIDNPDVWFTYLDDRNLTSHTYKELNALKVYKNIPSFYKDGLKLFHKLQSFIQK